VGIKSELVAEMHDDHIPFPSHETVTTARPFLSVAIFKMRGGSADSVVRAA